MGTQVVAVPKCNTVAPCSSVVSSCTATDSGVRDDVRRKCFPARHRVLPLSESGEVHTEPKTTIHPPPHTLGSIESELELLPTFWEVFGLSSVPFILVALICLCWTIWLIILTIAPNETVNFLVSTEDFDDGRFWMLVDQSTEMKVVVVGALSVVAVSYGHVVAKVMRHRPGRKHSWLHSLEGKLDGWVLTSPSEAAFAKALRLLKLALSFWRELTGIRGRNRKLWNLWLKLMDLFMQTLMLRQMMLNGASLIIMISYTVFLVVHSAVFAVVLTARYHTALGEILIDSAFDLIATIAFPMLTLLHAYMTCDIDYESFRIYNEVLPPGSFERRARMMADPNETARFKASVDALRILSASDLVLRIGMHLFFSYRFNRVVDELVRQRAPRERLSTMEMQANQRHVPKAMSLVFAVFSVAVVAVVSTGVTRSRMACAPYPQCVVFTHWSDSSGHCPCLTLIDIDTAPRSFDKWMNPPDVTESVRALARTGNLRVLQLVNRNLPTLPEELRECEALELLSLVYTGMGTVPAWFKLFKRLEYLQLDGRFGGQTLQVLPTDLFSDFPLLFFLQIGVHTDLKQIPVPSGLPSLRNLFFSRMFSITEVPSLLNMPHLERFELGYLPSLRALPDLGPVKDSLVQFALNRPNHVCCNGFMGACNLSHPFCIGIPSVNIPAATCITDQTEKATPVTIATIQRFNDSVCRPSTIDISSDFPNQERMEMCNGVLYRECRVGDKTGICYNSRLQGIGCTTDVNKIKIRRLQIARGAGLRCDPVEEAWLGCGIRPAST